jgi:P-type Mg2+ transporter
MTRPRREHLSPLLIEVGTFDPAAVLARLQTSDNGLTDEESQRRRGIYGSNSVAHESRSGLWAQLLKRLLDPLVIMLVVLGIVSILMGDARSAILILGMVALSISLGLIQERKSNKAAEKLRAMVHTTATVVRDAQTCDLSVEDLVPGDIVHLSAGDMIPADVRLIAAKDLFVNQAAVTGESLPVEKYARAGAVPAGDIDGLTNICLMGTTVVSGSATAVVVLTGKQAYFGGLAAALAGARPLTSFDRGISRFARLIIRFILVMVPLVFLVNGLTKHDWIQALLFATAVAVGLTPEMLPMIVTVNLAKGALAMSRRRVIVKRLNAIQNFGAMDVLCTDKTGTLTQDRVILRRALDLNGEDSREVLEYAFLNSHFQSGLKSLLDVAVLHHPDGPSLLELSRDFRKIDEVPFDFERRRMSVVVEGRGRRLLICKGAVEEVCAVANVGQELGRRVSGTDNALNVEGFRVIAVAVKDLPASQASCAVHDEHDLTLVGFIAFLDPPKETAGRAIAALAAHGVQVKVLTGDNEIVARKICREVGLASDSVVLGRQLEALGSGELAATVERVQIFAKLSPSQKALVITALQRNGHVVGFLGDGINDGPALQAADVGISVDSAVDIAKETADIILLEKSLLVLDEGVMEGRKVFGNVVKYIRMGASSNFGNMFSVLGASAWLPFLPMSPLQVIINNLLYDFSQTAIPSDNVDPEYLEKPRRWEIANIGRYMLFIGPISSIFDYATFLAMYYLFGASSPARAALFQTGWFVESIISQTLIIHVIRTRRLAFIESRASVALTLTTFVVCVVGMWLPYSPFARVLGFVALPWGYWPVLGLMIVAYVALTHMMKLWFHRRFGLD